MMNTITPIQNQSPLTTPPDTHGDPTGSGSVLQAKDRFLPRRDIPGAKTIHDLRAQNAYTADRSLSLRIRVVPPGIDLAPHRREQQWRLLRGREKDNSRKNKRDEEPRAKRRKSRRGADGAATAGLVQSFQLKNGSKHSRLTLKPDVSAGIFKHGRSSGPVAPGGKGLPDLVFNEMRFLQNPKEHQNELPAAEPPKQPLNKSRKQLREEEVSSFFANKPPAEKCLERPHSREVRKITAEKNARRSQTSCTMLEKPPIELPDNLFLGFGSRGPSHDISAVPRGSNSEYTWSESPARAERPIVQPRRPSRPPSSRTRHTSHISNTAASRPGHAASGTHPSRDRANERSQRPDRPVLAEIQPHLVNNRRRHTNVVVSSESLPKIRPKRRATATLSGNGDDTRRSSFHTSDILNLAGPCHTAYAAPAPRVLQSEHGATQPVSSGPDSEALRKAFDAVVESHRQSRPENIDQRRPQERHESYREGQHPRGTMFQTHEMSEQASERPGDPTPRWVLPQRGFGRASEHSRSLQDSAVDLNTARRTISRQSLSHGLLQQTAHAQGYIDYDQDDDMLDYPSAAIPAATAFDNYAYRNSRQTEDLVHQLTFDQDDWPYAHEPSQTHYQEAGVEPSAGGQLWTDLPADLEFDDDQELEQEEQGDTVMEDDQEPGTSTNMRIEPAIDDELVGFWRPNRLY
ncbi:unnamed protein product [Zymoseptoria tritici ST99CH_1E4]|uniref:Uncharacterized protein n=1 Tax=Zymoseptoria tritici ST99CH_1E4 TaxID=1276532 RepID=A0A2H1GGP0_ZYMTR|nr:unnamed protein product [Zymoseptoria tritici ST99CH_1E4]